MRLILALVSIILCLSGTQLAALPLQGNTTSLERGSHKYQVSSQLESEFRRYSVYAQLPYLGATEAEHILRYFANYTTETHAGRIAKEPLTQFKQQQFEEEHTENTAESLRELETFNGSFFGSRSGAHPHRGLCGLRRHSREIVVAFAGTVEMRHWLYDVSWAHTTLLPYWETKEMRYMTRNESRALSPVQVHWGFYQLYLAVREGALECISAAIERMPDYKRVSLAGHSMGASSAEYLRHDLLVHQLRNHRNGSAWLQLTKQVTSTHFPSPASTADREHFNDNRTELIDVDSAQNSVFRVSKVPWLTEDIESRFWHTRKLPILSPQTRISLFSYGAPKVGPPNYADWAHALENAYEELWNSSLTDKVLPVAAQFFLNRAKRTVMGYVAALWGTDVLEAADKENNIVAPGYIKTQLTPRYRLVAEGDQVPTMPFSWQGYVHMDRLYYLRNGRVFRTNQIGVPGAAKIPIPSETEIAALTGMDHDETGTRKLKEAQLAKVDEEAQRWGLGRFNYLAQMSEWLDSHPHRNYLNMNPQTYRWILDSVVQATRI